MNTSGLFTVQQVTVKAKVGETFTLVPFGDVHRDAPTFAHEEWKDFLHRARQLPNPLFLGMGDYQDCASGSERIVIGDDRLHESTKAVLSGHSRGVCKTLVNELGFMKGRLLGMIGGNHFFTFENGSTSEHVLCDALGAKFLGVCSLIRITFICSQGKSRPRSVSLDIMAHHGKGGGSLAGSTFNTVEKMQAVAEADIYLMGHDHSKGVIPAKPRLRLTTGCGSLTVKERTPFLGRTGSFLKAYEPGMVNYNVDACRAPAALGWIEFALTIHRDQSNDDDHLSVKIRGTA